ncbi:hypothetical protein CBS147321_11052 [Aspergillus niger]|nr:hypothetical protein CBS12448_10558 [Aspergillus niger]KAI2925548.1 hypothetical protein CBS147320_6059 [Aspergillus niger]KAI2928433.1 hypothetical protein CBS147321_11052 [Aspergillus niger]KAI2937270.1 hypothetical protein CBS147322_10916 [Aspergillus niger]KAI2974977.1 hypothetical protein CBS147324_3162 [Aspergillus niger]
MDQRQNQLTIWFSYIISAIDDARRIQSLPLVHPSSPQTTNLQSNPIYTYKQHTKYIPPKCSAQPQPQPPPPSSAPSVPSQPSPQNDTTPPSPPMNSLTSPPSPHPGGIPKGPRASSTS